ncbi:putative transporter [Andreesenia angusta]|uniref:Putative transporter n=1 Tax=Andreesenia angusta TaxID=39480 RepID=A0A1S1VAA4_9FIRM|nr:MFS transporter [Andreesenia angusta]OHW63512.1 putative transporter [Andreesenia angusta]
MDKSSSTQDLKLTRSLLLLMALTSGVSIAGVTYNQPLLEYMASSFSVPRSSIGLVSTFTQIGYGCGMLFIVPMGDIVERKSLILRTLCLCMFSLAGLSLSMNFYWLLGASFLVGFSSIITQLLVPLAASLSEPGRRGKAIGTVISGLITGIIAARLVSGFVGPRLGWRAVYMISPVFIALLAFTLRKYLPRSAPSSDESYFEILKSMAGVLRTNPVVRSSSMIGPCLFASFQLFWTSIVFFLESPAYGFSSTSSEIAGRFGLVGIAGVFLVPMMGTLSDRRTPRFAIGLSAALAFSAFLIMTVFGENIFGLALGVMILDFATNSSQVSNQARINSVESPRQSRFNSVFMSIYFFVGALGSYLGSFTFSKFGWTGVCATGLVFVSIALLAHFTIGRIDYAPDSEY